MTHGLDNENWWNGRRPRPLALGELQRLKTLLASHDHLISPFRPQFVRRLLATIAARDEELRRRAYRFSPIQLEFLRLLASHDIDTSDFADVHQHYTKTALALERAGLVETAEPGRSVRTFGARLSDAGRGAISVLKRK